MFEVRQDRAGEAFVHAGPDRMGVASDEPASKGQEMIFNPKLFEPMPEEVWQRTPPRLRVMYMVKRILNQAQQAAALKAKRERQQALIEALSK